MSTVSSVQTLSQIETTLNGTKLIARWRDGEFIDFVVSRIDKPVMGNDFVHMELFRTTNKDEMVDFISSFFEFSTELRQRNK